MQKPLKRIAIMQPYFLPYLGYFRLCAAVDHFIFLDNVNYINRGFINRNRILLNDRAHTFTLPLAKASQHKLIQELFITEAQYKPHDLLTLMTHAYKKAPYFADIYPLLTTIFTFSERHLVTFIQHAAKQYLAI